MNDAEFIERMVLKGKEAGEKVKNEFSFLSSEQLNWKPSPEKWSIGQCLDHLLVSDMQYFPVLQKIAEKKYKMTFWEKWSPFSILFGRMLAQQLQENVSAKLKTPKIFRPGESNIDAGIFERFQKHLDTLLEYISTCRDLDTDKLHITSPVSNFITYSLRNAIKILIQHEHRHINQAAKVKADKNFPA